MRIVHYYSRLLRHQSGVTMSLASWARAQQERAHEVTLVSAPAGREQKEDLEDLDVRVIQHFGRSRPTCIPRELGRCLRNVDLLVLHEGWVASNAAAALAARRADVPYVVIPHGVYEPGVMRGLKARKFIRQRMERAILEASAGVHVFFPSEAGLIRRIAPRADCFAVPTGSVRAVGGWTGGGGYIAWFGRYAPEHKGLTRLLEAWAAIDVSQRPRLRMHGTDYEGGLAEVRTQIADLGLGDQVSVGGPVYGEEKEELLRRAEAYVHPSQWESHSVALVEALERGVPSIVSDSIHIATSLADASAALVTPITPAGVESALRRLRTDQVHLSARALEFVQCNLGWDTSVKAWDEALKARL